MDKGFLYNVKNLLLRPQATVEAYIEGRHKGIFNPISFLVLAVTLYLLVDAYVGGEGVSRDGYSSEVYKAGLEAGRFLKVYFKYFWILSVAWLSFSTKLVFGKYNIAEHFAINAFVIGQATLVGFVGFVFTKIAVLLFNPLIYLSILWMTYKIFKGKRRSIDALLASLGAVLLFFLQLIVITVLIGVLRS